MGCLLAGNHTSDGVTFEPNQNTSMKLFAAAARQRLGELVGGTEAEPLRAAAAQFMETQGVKAPERMVAMLAPGFSLPSVP
jgi:hypothetical protein